MDVSEGVVGGVCLIVENTVVDIGRDSKISYF